MKILTKLIFAIALFCLGLLLGWRLTIVTARVEIESDNLVSVTAWGQTDLYVDCNPGQPDEISFVDCLGF